MSTLRPGTRGRRPECVPIAVTNRGGAWFPSLLPSTLVSWRTSDRTARVPPWQRGTRRRLDHLRKKRVHLGWAIFALTAAALAAGLALDLRLGAYSTLVYHFVDVALALIAVLLTTRRPEHPISWVLALTALGWALGGIAHPYAVEAIVANPGSLPGGMAAAWIDNWLWLPALALPMSVLLVLMPDGRLASRRWWPAPAAVAVGTLLGRSPSRPPRRSISERPGASRTHSLLIHPPSSGPASPVPFSSSQGWSRHWRSS